MEITRPAYLEINLNNLQFNINQIQNKVGKNVKLMPVIKASGYGTYINRRIDLTGQKHGHLTALYIHPEQKKQNQNLIWICQCDCGNLTEVSTANFKHTNSCGKCNKKSIGEEKIEKILIESNIFFIK